MLEPRRIMEDKKPDLMVDLNNGKWYYNYDIQSEKVEWSDTENMESSKEPTYKTMYSYICIKLNGKPTYKTVVETLIREYITQSQEFDLINSANKAVLLNDKSNEDVAEYLEYLAQLEEIKSKVRKEMGIE